MKRILFSLSLVFIAGISSCTTQKKPKKLVRPFVITEKFVHGNSCWSTYYYQDSLGTETRFEDRTDAFKVGDTL